MLNLNPFWYSILSKNYKISSTFCIVYMFSAMCCVKSKLELKCDKVFHYFYFGYKKINKPPTKSSISNQPQHGPRSQNIKHPTSFRKVSKLISNYISLTKIMRKLHHPVSTRQLIYVCNESLTKAQG